MSADKPKVAIVGAGLSGALLAIYLARAGYQVEHYERRCDPRRENPERGRSINLALSTRGIDALERIGVARDVLRNAIPMRGRMIHSSAGELTFQPYGTEKHHYINSISRGGLNIELLNVVERFDNVKLFFDSRCIGANLDKPSIEITQGSSNHSVEIDADMIIGADGAYSVVRQQMQKRDRFDFQQNYLSHGYKELTIVPGQGGQHQLEKNALHIWPRGGFMMIALPNSDGSFTCTLFWPWEGSNNFSALQTESQILNFFKQEFSDAVPLMPNLVDDYLHNPTSSLVTVRSGPWYCEDKVVLVGDAAHAVVPFYGQGMNASFEDCVVLDECLRQHEADRRRAFQEYYDRRKVNTDALSELAVENFLEMRDHVTSPWFHVKKKVEHGLHRCFPQWYVPLYSMVTFSTIPYAQARARAQKQSRMIRAIVLGVLLVIMVMVGFIVG